MVSGTNDTTDIEYEQINPKWYDHAATQIDTDRGLVYDIGVRSWVDGFPVDEQADEVSTEDGEGVYVAVAVDVERTNAYRKNTERPEEKRGRHPIADAAERHVWFPDDELVCTGEDGLERYYERVHQPHNSGGVIIHESAAGWGVEQYEQSGEHVAADGGHSF